MSMEKHRVACGREFMAAIRPDGRVVTYGFTPEYFDVSRWTDVVHISALEYGMIGLTSDGKVYVTGCMPTGRYSPVPLCRNAEDPVVATDVDYAEYVGGLSLNLYRKDGTEGCLNLSTGEFEEGLKTYRGLFHPPVMAIRPDGTAEAEGLTEEQQSVVAAWTDLVDAAGGHVFVIGLKRDGSIVSTGSIFPACMSGESEMNRKLAE